MKIKERKDRLKKKSLKKIKEGKVTKSKNLPKVLSDPAKDGKGPLDELKEILKCDHIVTFTYNKISKSDAKTKWKFLVENAFCNGLEIVFETWEKSGARLGLKISDDAIKNDILVGNVVIGPEADNVEAVKIFHSIWGKPNCKLRRFQDGKIKESIEVSNDLGPGYLPVSKLKFLLEKHFDDCKMTISKFEDDTIQETIQADVLKRKLRLTVDKFTSLLQELSSNGSLPLRQVRACCSCLHNGDITHGHFAEHVETKKGKKSKVVEVDDDDGLMLLKLKSEKSPPVTRPIEILLEITLKDKLSPKLFSRIRMTYSVALKNLLKNLGIKCVMKQGSSLFLVYNSVFFSLRIQNPNSLMSRDSNNLWKFAAVSEFIQRVGSPNSSWTGLGLLVQRWVRANGFETFISSAVLDLFSAWLYFDGGNKKPDLDATSSVERAFLMFLHKLSFTDFQKNPLFLTLPDEFDSQDFANQFMEKRVSFPALTIVTPLDITPSSYTTSLPQIALTRMVNCARKHLHDFTSGFPTVTFSKLLLDKTFGGFDAVIRLKPLLVPSFKRYPTSEAIPENIEIFPIVGYNPVQSFLTEAEECFGSHVKFFYNRSSCAIGIKVHHKGQAASEDLSKAPSKPDFDPNLMIEDLKVLGNGLILGIEQHFVN